ncbi:MAG: hypothetical protein M1281_07020 [Chloroflexi bacterium]|nr:hypothetical protein [Chloroflexota bacterium]
MYLIKKWLPFIALIGISTLILTLALAFTQRSTTLVDDGVTRQSVEASLQRLLPGPYTSLQDPGLLSALGELDKEPYVAAVWLVDPAGVILFHTSGPGKVGDTIQTLAAGDMAPSLAALPVQALSQEQEFQLLAVGAIRSEGEHNDVFRQRVYPLTNAQEQTIGLVVLDYDISPQVASPGAAWIILLLGALIGLAVYWLSLPLWVALDARERGESPALWGLFVLATNLIGLLAYLLSVSRKPPSPSQGG